MLHSGSGAGFVLPPLNRKVSELSVNLTVHLNATIICLQYPVYNGCHKTGIIFFVEWLFRERRLLYPGNLGPGVVGTIKSDCL